MGDEESVMVAREPERLGPFELIKRIGTGGFCETYLARQHGPEGFVKDVCLKRVLPERAGDPEYVAPMRDEAVLQATLSHPNIVKVHDFRKIDGQHVIVMDYVDGASLSELLRFCRSKKEPFPTALALHVMHKVLLALSSAHRLVRQGEEQHLIHRDINPKNVLIDREGHPMLIDFGLVKAKHRTYRTQSGFVRGTIPYTAPETIMLGVPGKPQQEDCRTDIYAVGVVLYELLAGRHPYVRPGMVELQIAPFVVKGEHVHLREVAPSLPKGLADIVEGMMAAKMHARPATALDACRLLAPYLPLDFDAQLELSSLVVRSLGNRPSLATGYARPDLTALTGASAESGVQSREQERVSATPSSSVAPEAPRVDQQATLPLEGSLSTAITEVPGSTDQLATDPPVASRGPGKATIAIVLAAVIAAAVFFALRQDALPRQAAVSPAPTPTVQAPSAPVSPEPSPAVEATSAAAGTPPPPAAAMEAPEAPTPAEPPVVESPNRKGTSSKTTANKTAKLIVNVENAEGWEVWVDDVYMGQSPARIAVAAGKHTVSVGKERPSLTQLVRVGAQQTKNVRFTP